MTRINKYLHAKIILNKKHLYYIAGFALIGVIALGVSKAFTYTASVEAEGSVVSAPAKLISDPSASNGTFIKFTPYPTFSFTAAGDHDFDSQAFASMDIVAGSGSSFYIALGDLSYRSGYEDDWCAAFKSRFNDVEVLAGNHDTGESSGGDISRYIQFCPFTLGSLVGDYGKQYYFDYPQENPLARFVLIAPGVRGSLNINYSQGGAGYQFTKDVIDSAQAAGIKWIIVGMHKNCISTGTKSCEVGTDIMNLLINEKVDLVLQSHDHSYQRTHALKCITTNSFNSGCVADSGSDGLYKKGLGPVILINGEFGRSLYTVSSSDSEVGYFAKIDATTFGVTKYTLSGDELSAQYLRSSGGSFADSFTIRE